MRKNICIIGLFLVLIGCTESPPLQDSYNGVEINYNGSQYKIPYIFCDYSNNAGSIGRNVEFRCNMPNRYFIIQANEITNNSEYSFTDSNITFRLNWHPSYISNYDTTRYTEPVGNIKFNSIENNNINWEFSYQFNYRLYDNIVPYSFIGYDTVNIQNAKINIQL